MSAFGLSQKGCGNVALTMSSICTAFWRRIWIRPRSVLIVRNMAGSSSWSIHTCTPHGQKLWNEDAQIVQRGRKTKQRSQSWSNVRLFDSSVVVEVISWHDRTRQAFRDFTELRRQEDKSGRRFARCRPSMIATIVHPVITTKDEQGGLMMWVGADGSVDPFHNAVHFLLLRQHVDTAGVSLRS